MLELNKIYCGDCLELMKQIPDKSIDLVLTDPPYGITACEWDILPDLDIFWQEIRRIKKYNCGICIFGSEPFSSKLRLSNLKEWKYDWIWHKSIPTGMMSAKYMPMKNHEIISVFGNKINYYPVMEKRSENTNKTGNGGLYKSKSEHTDNFISKRIPDELANKDRFPTSVKFFKNVHSKNKLF